MDYGVFRDLTVTAYSSLLPWPWTQGVRDDFLPAVQGFWPWNSLKKRITAFRNRVQGPYPATMHLQRGAWSSMEDFLAAGGLMGRIPPVPVQAELPALCEWMAARPEMAQRVRRVSVVPSMTEYLPPGSWVRAELHEPDVQNV